MLETIILAMLVAKLKGYKPSQLLKAWPVYLIIMFEIIYIFLQASTFLGNYSLIKYSSLIEKPFLFIFFILILIYKQYVSALIGSIFMLIGGILNNIVIAANSGKMPVFPTLSYFTGYVKQDLWRNVNDIHTLGTAGTNLKFLSDIFDLGYCIMSIGDIFIRVFVFLVIFNTIKQLTLINYKKRA